MIISPLRGLRVVDINCEGCKWREAMNAELSIQLEFIKQELEYERSTRVQLNHTKTEVEVENWEPVGGYKSVRQRIAEAESKSREELMKEENAAKVE